MEKMMTAQGDTVMIASTDEPYGNTRRQLDRQNEVIDFLASRVQVLEQRLDHILQQPEPRPTGSETDTPYLPGIPLTISSHTDRLEEILHRVIDITDRVDL